MAEPINCCADTTIFLRTTVQVVNDAKRKARAKLEVALLNALARLGVPVLFGGDIQCGGPSTPRFDLVAINSGTLPMQSPVVVLISCKSTKK